jgi:hypothetical protein
MSEYMNRFYGMCDECHFMDDLARMGDRYLCYVCLSHRGTAYHEKSDTSNVLVSEVRRFAVAVGSGVGSHKIHQRQFEREAAGL